jgi:hypothetical protein
VVLYTQGSRLPKIIIWKHPRKSKLFECQRGGEAKPVEVFNGMPGWERNKPQIQLKDWSDLLPTGEGKGDKLFLILQMNTKSTKKPCKMKTGWNGLKRLKLLSKRNSRISNQYVFTCCELHFKGCQNHSYTRSAPKLSLLTETREEQDQQLYSATHDAANIAER